MREDAKLHQMIWISFANGAKTLQNRTGERPWAGLWLSSPPPSATLKCNPCCKRHFVALSSLSHFVPSEKFEKFNVDNLVRKCSLAWRIHTAPV